MPILRVHELCTSWDPFGDHLSLRSRTANALLDSRDRSKTQSWKSHQSTLVVALLRTAELPSRSSVRDLKLSSREVALVDLSVRAIDHIYSAHVRVWPDKYLGWGGECAAVRTLVRTASRETPQALTTTLGEVCLPRMVWSEVIISLHALLSWRGGWLETHVIAQRHEGKKGLSSTPRRDSSSTEVASCVGRA